MHYEEIEPRNLAGLAALAVAGMAVLAIVLYLMWRVTP